MRKRTVIPDKSTMYPLLIAGYFGNTVPQYLSVEAWQASGDGERYQFWGVRSGVTANHPKCKFFVPSSEVAAYALAHFADGPNISMMVDAVAHIEAWLEIWDSPGGLVVEGIEQPRIADDWTWRNSMPNPDRRRRWEGSAARCILARYLNANSRDDLEVVLASYPGAVVEMSALDRCLGTVPHRNCIVWEVRSY